MRRIATVLVAALPLLSVTVPMASASDPDIVRLFFWGGYATAIEASELGFDSADRGYVAVGANFPDALSGAAAGFYDVPVLLVPSGSLPADVAAEITRLGASKVIILRGTSVVSLAVEAALEALLGT